MTTKSNGKTEKLTGLEIAVIGMSGRFPGASNIEEFWNNLKVGKETVTFFSDEELEKAGVAPELIKNPNYVKAKSVLEGKDCFDASFFGYKPREAEVMAPHIRLFFECTWSALEDAGYAPHDYEGLIGCYAGASSSFEWQASSFLSGKHQHLGIWTTSLLSGKDNLSTFMAYKLDLKGPCFTFYTTCSTSLVAVHLGCRALLTGECSMALVGGIALDTSGEPGYLYEEGMTFSPDAHCRTFDAKAKGTIFGEGVGVVVLRRFQEAVQDGDHIYAVIKGSAINNDGADRVGYTAPGTLGQREVVKLALKIARVEPESIGYVETHGTATPLGDPIEITALTQAFNTDKKHLCAIGSVKTNVGHLDAAAGITGFIKTVLALKYRLLPPSLHFVIPNPKIDLENSPFYVVTELTEWKSKNSDYPLRAGVSSFGIGGTNAHVILEEAPIAQSAERKAQSAGREYQLILLSAKTSSALDKMAVNLAEYLKKNPDINLVDAAFTLQVGRQAFKHRLVCRCASVQEAVHGLSSYSSNGSAQVQTSVVKEEQKTTPEITNTGEHTLDKLGQLWLLGKKINWDEFYSGETRHRIPLPSYPFERQYYWLEGDRFKINARTNPGASAPKKKSDVSSWFYIPLWKQSTPTALKSNDTTKKSCWLVLLDETGFSSQVVKQLQAEEQDVIIVKVAAGFSKENDNAYTIHPGQRDDYDILFNQLHDIGRLPGKILHLWGVDFDHRAGSESPGVEWFNEVQDRGFYSLVYLAQALGKMDLKEHIRIFVVTNDLQDISGEEVLSPEKATVLGPVMTINQEYTGISCRSIDIHLPGPEPAPGNPNREKLIRQLLEECQQGTAEVLVAYRNNHRWLRAFEPVQLENPKEVLMVKPKGVYLITGGLGSVGFLLAKDLVRRWGAKLVLTGRSQLPPENEWNQWLAAHDQNDPISSKLKKVIELQEMGAELLVFSADAADRKQMEAVIQKAEQRLGPISGVIYAASIMGKQAFQTLDQLEKAHCQQQFQAKVHGVVTLQNIFRHKALDFCLLMSSIASHLGGFGLTAYSAANIFMDAFAAKHKRNSGFPRISVNWDRWQPGEEKEEFKNQLLDAVINEFAMSPQQGVNAFLRILDWGGPQVVVSTGDLDARVGQWVKVNPIRPRAKRPDSLKISVAAYAPPRNQVESTIARVLQEYLGIDQVGIQDSFFDLGATSLDLAQINIKLNEALGKEVPLVDLLTYPTIASLTGHLTKAAPGNKTRSSENRETEAKAAAPPGQTQPAPTPYANGREVAIIGMAGRFPGAKNVEELWENLKNGVDTVSFFSNEELEKAGIDGQLMDDPDYIKAKGMLAGVEYFDASFFDYTPREAEMMDPQVRIFHECTWEALEHAGYDSYSCPESIGFYVGANPHPFWDVQFLSRRFDGTSEQFSAFQYYDKDYMGTRISHKLNLKGPALSMYTACSSSLVAVHLAYSSILKRECDMALAGGVTVFLPEKSGYLFEDGLILSQDGHNRTFDAKATGSIFGEGAGVVLLKDLQRALADGNTIHAVIKGSAINNDGKRKLAYTAPSVEGQAEVIRTAQEVASVEPGSISYLEAHGTATPLGDMVEMEALNQVFGHVNKKQFCGIGTVKSNMGHLNIAAGVTGLIKTVMAIKHKLIPPSLHFETPNPKIDFENSPFYVVARLTEWEKNGYPLRAGVSSFGIGGTNAHVILEEPPPISTSSPGKKWKLLMLSAKTKTSLDKTADNLVQFLKENPRINLWDVAYTLQVGRKHFQHRKMVICSTTDEAVQALSSTDLGKRFSGSLKNQSPAVVFIFPGQGSQYIDMGRGLYQQEKIFREEMDRCFEIYQSLTNCDIKEILYPKHTPALTGHPSQEGSRVSGGSSDGPAGWSLKDQSPLERGTPDPRKGGGVSKINQTEISQPLIFMFEYALAKLAMSWGIRPEVMIGYSFGEYAAACISGVFSLEDALRLVVLRGRLMKQLPEGAMLSVPIPREELKPLLENQPSLAIAIDNGPSCVVSGTCEAIAAFEKQMKEKKLICIRVNVSHACHSEVMEPVLAEFSREVRNMKLNEPQIPYISNVTGKTVNPGEVTDAIYWVKHLKDTVLFYDGINEVLKIPHPIFLEVGPGRDLSVLLRSHKDYNSSWRILNLVQHEKEEVPDLCFLLNRVGHLWLYGVDVDWQGFYAAEKRHRIPLPTYNFESRHFPIYQLPSQTTTGKLLINLQQRKAGIDDWFYKPFWKRVRITKTAEPFAQSGGILLFTDEYGLGSKIKTRLSQQGFRVFVVQAGDRFTQAAEDEYTVNPVETDDYEALLKKLHPSAHLSAISTVLHLWNVTPVAPNAGGNGNGEPGPEWSDLEKELDRGFYSLIALAQALVKQEVNNIQVKVVTNNVQDVIGAEAIFPGKSTSLGPINVMELEFPGIHCCMIDLILPEPGSQQEQELVSQLVQEFKIKIHYKEKMVAYRNGHRWVQGVEPLEMKKDLTPAKGFAGLREKGVYLITGGVGGIGLILAQYLAESVKAKLILTGISAFPRREQWDEWVSTHPPEDKTSQKIRKIRQLEALGADVLVFSADTADFNQMQRVIEQGERDFGKLNGVIHAAGLPDGAMIPLRTREISERVLAPKVAGTLVLDQLLKDSDLDFWMFCSSIASMLSFVGQTAYVAANAFLDSFAVSRRLNNGITPVSINWDRWEGVGIAVIAEKEHKIFVGENMARGITPPEGKEVFGRILAEPLPRVIVSVFDLEYRIDHLNTFDISCLSAEPGKTPGDGNRAAAIQQRPELSVDYVEPSNEIEQKLARVWQEYLGIEQVGSHDNFFELGATSMDIIQVNNRLNHLLGEKIPVVKLLTHTTVHTFANYYMEEILGEKPGDRETDRTAAIQRGKQSIRKKFNKMREKERLQ